MRASNATLLFLMGRVGDADKAAFRSLYATAAPEILSQITVRLPDPVHAMNVLRATFCEVWRLSAFHVRSGSRPDDVATWMSTIATRRAVERAAALRLIAVPQQGSPGDPAWADLIQHHDAVTEAQLAEMLGDGEAGALRPPALTGSAVHRTRPSESGTWPVEARIPRPRVHDARLARPVRRDRLRS